MSGLEILVLSIGTGIAAVLAWIAVSLNRLSNDFRVSIQDAASRSESAIHAEEIGLVDNLTPLPAGLLRPTEDDFELAEKRRSAIEKRARKNPYGQSE